MPPGEGYAGDPTAATAEYGYRRLDSFAEDQAELIKAMIEAEKAYGKC